MHKGHSSEEGQTFYVFRCLVVSLVVWLVGWLHSQSVSQSIWWAKNVEHKRKKGSDLPESNQRPKEIYLQLQSSALPTELRSVSIENSQDG